MDIFATNEFLRFKKDSSYRTISGGVCSIIAFTLFAAMFTNIIIDTLSRATPQSIIVHSPSIKPLNLTTSVTDSSPFFFAVGISNLDLTQSTKYFEILLLHKKKTNNTLVEDVSIPLNSCVASQWANVSSEVDKAFVRLNLSKWLCPPENKNFSLDGTFTSESF